MLCSKLSQVNSQTDNGKWKVSSSQQGTVWGSKAAQLPRGGEKHGGVSKKLSCRLEKGQEPQSHLGKQELPFLSCFRFHTLQRPLKWYPHAEANAFQDLRPHTMARSLNRHCCQNRHALLQRSHQHEKFRKNNSGVFRKNNCGVSNGNFKHGSDWAAKPTQMGEKPEAFPRAAHAVRIHSSMRSPKLEFYMHEC